MGKRISASVLVEMKVQVHVGSWEASASFDSLQEQARREARNSLEHHLRNTNVKVLGEPGVMSVVLKEGN